MALNFLPDRLLIVLRKEDVVANLEDFWRQALSLIHISEPTRPY